MALQHECQTITGHAQKQMNRYPAHGVLSCLIIFLVIFAPSSTCYSLSTVGSMLAVRNHHDARYAYCEPRKKPQDDIVVTVTGSTFSCDESSCAHYYGSCRLAIDYTVATGSLVGGSVDTAVSCKAKILYRTEHGYLLSSETEAESIHHGLHAASNDRSTINLCFQFSSYEAVVETSLHSVECLIKKAEPLFQRISISGR